MATYNKYLPFADILTKGGNVSSDQFAVFLTNTAPTNTDTALASVAGQPSYTNCSSRAITTTSSTTTSGTMKLILADLTLTASGGTVGPFRYIGIYDDTIASPADPPVAWYDYGSSITLADTETFLINFDGTNGFFTVA